MLKEILSSVISPNYSVPGRQITDNIVACQEMIHTLKNKKGRKGGMIVKIDMEKAYKRLEWPFIVDTLQDVGLPETMVNVIMRCVSNATFRLLWNGECTNTIQQTRRQRQGDPLSHYLFVLCLERLVHMIQQEVERGRWKSLKVLRSGPGISHLFFADNLLFFVESKKSPNGGFKGMFGGIHNILWPRD